MSVRMFERLNNDFKKFFQTRKILAKGIIVRSEFPEIVDDLMVATAVRIGNQDAVITNFKPPVMVCDELTCDWIYFKCYSLVNGKLTPVFWAKNLRRKEG